MSRHDHLLASRSGTVKITIPGTPDRTPTRGNGLTIRELLADLRAWPGSRGFYGAVAMVGFAGGFWLSVLAGPGLLFGRVPYPEPRSPGIVTVTVPAPTAITPNPGLPVAGERTGTGRRSSPVTTRRSSGATKTEVPAESKGRASVMQSPPPGPSSTTTTTTTTTTSTTTTTTTTKPPDDDDEGDDDDDE